MTNVLIIIYNTIYVANFYVLSLVNIRFFFIAALRAFPTNVFFQYRRKNELKVSWRKPSTQLCNCEITGYKICYSTKKNAECRIFVDTSETNVVITPLRPSTKYFITVSAKTNVGYGPKSTEVNKITNGGMNLFYIKPQSATKCL